VGETRLDLDRIRAARQVIDPVFLDTPLYECGSLGRRLGCLLSVKLETANPVRSFKARGSELVTSLLTDRGAGAVVCASAGNLGQALAWSAGRRGIRATVVASREAPTAKLDAIRALGAELELVDGDIEDARERAAVIAGRRDLHDHAGLVVEPSAALGVAAVREDRERFAGRQVVTIVCGGNVDPDAYRRWVYP
jgi:threonine dehydratase